MQVLVEDSPILAMTWPMRLVLSWDEFGRIPFLPNLLNVRHQLVGSVAVNNAVFAGAQGAWSGMDVPKRCLLARAEPLLRGETQR